MDLRHVVEVLNAIYNNFIALYMILKNCIWHYLNSIDSHKNGIKSNSVAIVVKFFTPFLCFHIL